MNLKTDGSVPIFHTDGLSITAAEPWFKVKVQVIQSYLQAFIMNASPKSDELIFIDLFSGSGLYSIGHQKDIFAGSCLTALSAALPFDRWLLCEKDQEQVVALENRIKKYFPNRNTSIVHTSQSHAIDDLIAGLPRSKAGKKVAILCLVDPFSLDVPLSLVMRLAASGCSFLMPFTFTLNSRIDCAYYITEHRDVVRRFAGESHVDQLSKIGSNLHFYRKLVRLYQHNMLMLGLNAALSSHKLESRLMDLPAYCIGFFSRQFSTQAVQRDVLVGEQMQYELVFSLES